MYLGVWYVLTKNCKTNSSDAANSGVDDIIFKKKEALNVYNITLANAKKAHLVSGSNKGSANQLQQPVLETA